ncbi:hypothetical protein MVES1_000705 [Malassezia vespertilionis]|uniref:UV radiation resistance-associated gene protein n=1 Tax=Malassezia vespertilionis TaxID=2020962 RepID=A0A2N1JGQ2_9BASI|nr:uncharacterized protein MVES1_000705 [Malassezia vespertilionis]PKI85726.1 hypothetical protein MVES_000659 [Malassezia vespertilionis]WFD05375.1 hypothetical protein MVES1_000705 [Malassezia vespertilionis]
MTATLSGLVAIRARNLMHRSAQQDAQGTAALHTTRTALFSCFVTLRHPGEVPFFVAPPSKPGRQASWGEYTTAPIAPKRDFGEWAWGTSAQVLVALWICGTDFTAWQRVWEVSFNLHHPPQASAAQENLVYLGFMRATEPDAAVEYITISPRTLDTKPTQREATSYTLDAALALRDTQADLVRTQATLRALRERTTSVLSGNSSLVQHRYLLQERHHVQHLQDALARGSAELSQLRESIVQHRERTNIQRQEASERGASAQQRMESRMERLRADSAAIRSQLLQLQQAVHVNRQRLFYELDTIYPIQLEDARELLYSIVHLPLPNGVASSNAGTGGDPESTASALAFAAQLVLLISAYLHHFLPYHIKTLGSRATMRDTISVMQGPRTFVLYGKGIERYRYEYGVFLLNKDIEHLMNQHHVPVLDLRNTLPNLKNLLVTLASAPYTPPYTP